jgi:sugar (pentulose or hexulose) kinase
MHTAVFDIGKTNKKFSVFDKNLSEIHRVYTSLPETEDEDGFPAEDLQLLTDWMQQTLQQAIESGDFHITKLNCSTYGASFVHVDSQGKPVTPLYNYLKPFPEKLAEDFFRMAGEKEEFCVTTASPWLGMLNSGLQIYWLQQQRPELFGRISHSMHFPQYCSSLFSGEKNAEYTSIGCHTGLWDFTAGQYHRWVKQTGINQLFPAIVPATHRTKSMIFGQEMEVGAGIHDSSAALLPYLLSSEDPFLLLSTGTWNITFNPFSTDPLTAGELNQDCLNFMRTDGGPVKASRLFFGNEFNVQSRKLAAYFGKTEQNFHHTIIFDEALYQKFSSGRDPLFHFETMQYPDGSISSAAATQWDCFGSAEEAFHRLMIEMVRLQAQSVRLAAGKGTFRKLFVDGGFSQSDVFIKLLQKEFPTVGLVVSPSPLGSSLGAAMAVNDPEVARNYDSDRRRVAFPDR